MTFNCITCRRRSGACGELKGDVGLYFVFVNEPKHSWDENEKAELRKVRKAVADRIVAEASNDGVSVRISGFEDTLTFTAPITTDADRVLDDLENKLIKNHGFSSIDKFIESVRTTHSLSSNAVMFFLDSNGRSFASQSMSENNPYRTAEAAVVYGSDKGTILHELLHLFGAADLYYPDKVFELAEKLFPNSIMKSSSNIEIDDLTRYLIGWRYSLTPDAKRIVNAGIFPSREAFDAELDKQWETKAYAVKAVSSGTYYGPTRNGWFHGKGKFVCNWGNVYEGDFVCGGFTGKGKLTYKNGSVYEGEFQDWNCVGRGKLRLANGSCYEGEFNGKAYPLRGRLRYPDGTVFEGEFDSNGNPVKKEHLVSAPRQTHSTLSDGSIYDGSMVNGKPHGRGVLCYASGSVLTGEFKNGKPEGSGTLIYKTGTIYRGDFRGGMPEGHGYMLHDSGWSYEGEFKDGFITGSGVFRDNSGKVHRIRVEGRKIIMLD